MQENLNCVIYHLQFTKLNGDAGYAFWYKMMYPEIAINSSRNI